MEISQNILDQLSIGLSDPYTEADIREMMAEIEIPQFADNERRVEFATVAVDADNGGAAYIKSDFQLTAIVQKAQTPDHGWYAIFMRMSLLAEEIEGLQFQQVVGKILAEQNSEAFDASDDEPANIVELFKARAGDEDA